MKNYRQNSSGSNLKVEGLCRVVSVVSCRVDRRSEGSQNQLVCRGFSESIPGRGSKLATPQRISGFGFLCNHVLVSILWILDDACIFMILYLLHRKISRDQVVCAMPGGQILVCIFFAVQAIRDESFKVEAR